MIARPLAWAVGVVLLAVAMLIWLDASLVAIVDAWRRGR